ncbi:MAG: hypothetical protein KIT00_02260 [Rhodospirillales bacterium]|nr:hypothetical protein [Rhodospirillales bacterium]
MATSGKTRRNDDGIVTDSAAVIADRFRVDFNAPLAHLDTPSSKAYAAIDRKNPDVQLFALVAPPTLPVRMEALERLQGNNLTGVMAPIASGAVACPGVDRKCLAIVYDQPTGGTLAEYCREGGISEFEFGPRVVEPVARALRSLAGCNVTHRAIRPDNLFFQDVAGGELVLGDCLTSPPGYDQPAVFEPIERAMAHKIGRGEGNTGDDLYAFGVTLVTLMLGRIPAAELDGALLTAKMENGSYGTLCNQAPIPLPMIEPLRGMLCDDPEYRWGSLELDGWLEGRRLNPVRPQSERKPLCSFRFTGSEYVSLRRLVRAMTRHVDEAARVIRNGDLRQWLDLRLKAPDLVAAVESATLSSNAAMGGPQGADDLLVAKVAILLDPASPIRFRGLSYMLDGLGPLLAATCQQDGDIQPVAASIALGLPTLWLAEQSQPRTRWNELPSFITSLQGYLNMQAPGGGWERCLYEINPGMPCQSRRLADAYIYHLDGLLRRLDALAEHKDSDRPPIDRHIAAFIATRADSKATPFLKALGDTKTERTVIGMLGLLALLQHQLEIVSLPHLCSWFGDMLGPVIGSYHGRTIRMEIERHLPKVIERGSLTALYALVENAERRRIDERSFAMAVSEFSSAEAEIHRIESDELGCPGSWTATGQRIAAALSLFATVFAIGIMAITRFI